MCVPIFWQYAVTVASTAQYCPPPPTFDEACSLHSCLLNSFTQHALIRFISFISNPMISSVKTKRHAFHLFLLSLHLSPYGRPNYEGPDNRCPNDDDKNPTTTTNRRNRCRYDRRFSSSSPATAATSTSPTSATLVSTTAAAVTTTRTRHVSAPNSNARTSARSGMQPAADETTSEHVLDLEALMGWRHSTAFWLMSVRTRRCQRRLGRWPLRRLRR